MSSICSVSSVYSPPSLINWAHRRLQRWHDIHGNIDRSLLSDCKKFMDIKLEFGEDIKNISRCVWCEKWFEFGDYFNYAYKYRDMEGYCYLNLCDYCFTENTKWVYNDDDDDEKAYDEYLKSEGISQYNLHPGEELELKDLADFTLNRFYSDINYKMKVWRYWNKVTFIGWDRADRKPYYGKTPLYLWRLFGRE